MKPLAELLDGSPVHCLPCTASVLAAAREMADKRIGAILVLDEQRRLAGIFTERDLMLRVIVAGRAPDSVRLVEVMTRELYTAGPEDRVSRVAQELQARHIRHCPVVKDGRIVGILSLRDLLRAHLQVKEREVRELTDYIQGTEPR
jgi:CBS domain-containing protein